MRQSDRQRLETFGFLGNPRQNLFVYMPIRNEDGSEGKRLILPTFLSVVVACVTERTHDIRTHELVHFFCDAGQLFVGQIVTYFVPMETITLGLFL